MWLEVVQCGAHRDGNYVPRKKVAVGDWSFQMEGGTRPFPLPAIGLPLTGPLQAPRSGSVGPSRTSLCISPEQRAASCIYFCAHQASLRDPWCQSSGGADTVWGAPSAVLMALPTVCPVHVHFADGETGAVKLG